MCGSSRRSSRTRARWCSAGATCRVDNSALSQGARDRRHRAVPPPGLHRPRHGRRRRGRVRAQALHHPQGHARRKHLLGLRAASRTISTSSRCRCRTVVYKGMFLALPARRLLPRPARPDVRVGAGARPPALLDQHLPALAAGASLSLRLPQRRDQHGARQRQLDGGARRRSSTSTLFGDDISKLWPISYRRPVGHRLLRQRARVPDARRLLAAARGDDADPRGLGGQPAHGRGAGAPSTSTTPR